MEVYFCALSAVVRLINHTGKRPPLKYDISVDEDPEFDPREHDWRFNLQTHLGKL